MNKAKSIFITGCDTDIGKTFVSVGLCILLQSRGLNVGYYKPFQSGAINGKAPDIEELRKYASIEGKYSYLFEGDISPHLASILNDVEVDIEVIKTGLNHFCSYKDFVVIEGAGGIYCPAVKGKLFADIIAELNQEIIIVTTPDLGRINHALMTIECARQKNINIKGVIINKMPKNPTLSQKNFVKELKMFSDVEILGIIPEMKNPTKNEIIEQFSSIIKL